MAPLEGRERQPPGPLFANYTRSSGSTQGRDGKNRALALRKQAAEGESRGLVATRACLRAVRAPCNRSHSRLVGGRSLLQSIHGDSNPSRREPQKHPNVGAFTNRSAFWSSDRLLLRNKVRNEKSAVAAVPSELLNSAPK